MTSFIRRHQKWLMVLIAITVITFLFWGSSVTRLERKSGSAGALGLIEGQPVSLEAYNRADVETRIHVLLSRGEWIDSESAAQRIGMNLEQETYMRLFLSKRAKDMGIHVDDEKIGRMAGQMLADIGGKNGPLPLTTLEEQVLKPHGLTIANFRGYLETQALIQELVAVVGQNGRLLTPQEAETDLRHESEEVTATAVFFPITNQLANVTATPEAIADFYQKNAASYHLPDRRQVSYVKFKAADHFEEADKRMGAITNFDAQLEHEYQRRGTNYYAGKTAAEAKAEIRAEIRRLMARDAAHAVAAKFADALREMTPASPANLDKLAADQKLTVDTSSPFSASKPPIELDVNTTFCRQAFAMSAEEPVAGPVDADDAVYVIALKKEIPNGVPALDTIRDTVAADCKMRLAAQLAYSTATNFAAKVTANPGKDLAALAAESKLEAVKLPPFSLFTHDLPEAEKHISLGYLQQYTSGLAVGSNSGLRQLPDGGVILQVTARTPAAESVIKAKLPDFVRQSRAARQNELFSAWLQREAGTALRETPIAKHATQQ